MWNEGRSKHRGKGAEGEKRLETNDRLPPVSVVHKQPKLITRSFLVIDLGPTASLSVRK